MNFISALFILLLSSSPGFAVENAESKTEELKKFAVDDPIIYREMIVRRDPSKDTEYRVGVGREIGYTYSFIYHPGKIAAKFKDGVSFAVELKNGTTKAAKYSDLWAAAGCSKSVCVGTKVYTSLFWVEPSALIETKILALSGNHQLALVSSKHREIPDGFVSLEDVALETGCIDSFCTGDKMMNRAGEVGILTAIFNNEPCENSKDEPTKKERRIVFNVEGKNKIVSFESNDFVPLKK